MYGKTDVHRSGANLQPSDYQPDTFPTRQCLHTKATILRVYFYHRVQGLFLLAVARTHADAGISSVVGLPVLGVHDLALVNEVAGIHAVLGVCQPYCYWRHALAVTHALVSVSDVVGSTVAGVITL
jgi:hypothetical protein